MSRRRTQVYFEPEQRAALDHQARRERRTISAIVREYIDQGLERRRAEIERRLAVLDELARLGAEIGPISGDPIAEAREERDREMEAVWVGRPTE
jgi:hypothetical protein